jgi:hypothetical protein
MKFQLVVIIILGILLIITLLAFYYIASSSGNNIQFPPSIPICPDYYYQVKSSNDNIICKALPDMEDALIISGLDKGLNQNKCFTTDFTPNFYSGSKANCNKYTWYKNCKSIPAWEGITYGVKNPCATT